MYTKFITYLCYAISVFFAIALTVVSPLLPEISRTYSLDMAKSGYIFIFNFLGFLIFVAIGGILSDIYGKKRILSVSIAGFSLCMLLLPLSPSFTILCLLSAINGGFIGILESQTSALVSQLNPKNTSFYVNMCQVFFGIGAVVGPVTAGAFVSMGISWRTYYFVIGCLSVILTAIFIFAKSSSLKQHVDIKAQPVSKFKINNTGFILICICMILYTGSEVGGWGWMSTFLNQKMNFSAMKSGAAVGLFWVAMTIGRLVCGSLTFKFKTRSIIIALSAMSAAVTAMSGIITSELAVWLVIIAMGLAYSSQWPLIVAYGSEYTGSSSGFIYSLLVGSGSIGSMLIPYFMGVIGQSTDIRLAMASPSVFLIAITIIFVFNVPKLHRVNKEGQF